jgi:hypothetical protein
MKRDPEQTKPIANATRNIDVWMKDILEIRKF